MGEHTVLADTRDRIGEVTISTQEYKELLENSFRLNLIKDHIKRTDLDHIRRYGDRDTLEVGNSTRTIVGYDDSGDYDVLAAIDAYNKEKDNEGTD